MGLPMWQFCVLSAVLCAAITGEAAMVDSVGRKFVFAYPKPYTPTSRYSNYNPSLYLVLTNPTSTSVTVDINLVVVSPPSPLITRLAQSATVTNKRPSNISISISDYFGSSWRTDGTQTPPTVKVTSPGDITVHAFYSYNQRYSSWYNMGTVILPTNALGTDHFIASFIPKSSGKSEFTVTATSEQTKVSIRTTDGRRDVITLEPFQTIQYLSDHDLTGSQISADRPIVVMAGASSAQIPQSVEYPNYLLVQIPSVSALGMSYILAPLKERVMGYFYRIVATKPNTLVSIGNGNPVEYHAGEIYKPDATNATITLISADKPILVVQYMPGYSFDPSNRGNAAMVVVPAIEMFSSSVTFPVTSLPSRAKTDYSLSIAIKCADSSGLMLDGIDMTQLYAKLMVPQSRMCILQSGLITAEQPHNVTHKSADAVFSVMVLGMSFKVGYMYMAGYNVKSRAPINVDNDTDLAVPPENSNGMVLTCDYNQMTIFLNKSLVIDGSPNDVHLNDPGCFGRLVITSTNRRWIRLQSLYSECGTNIEESESGSIYRNSLIYQGAKNGNLIGRDATFNLPITCTFNDRALASLRVAPQLSVINGSLSGRGKLANVSFSLKMYQSQDYLSSYRPEEFPVTVRVGKPIYLEASAKGDLELTLMVDSCLATHSEDPRQKPNYIFIDNGCPTDETITYYSDASSNIQRFSTIAFTLSDESSSTIAFIHCWLLACNASEESSRCQRSCDTREKREASESVDRYVVSWGPLIILPDSSQKHDLDHPVDSQFQFVSLIASLTVFLVSVAIASISTVAYFRLKRRIRQSSFSSWYNKREETYELLEMEDVYTDSENN